MAPKKRPASVNAVKLTPNKKRRLVPTANSTKDKVPSGASHTKNASKTNIGTGASLCRSRCVKKD
eukprot:6345245-Karenia_brevis.AAC.1